MERLTFEGKFCDIAKCSSTPGGSFCEDGACGWRRVWERLKAYEDTGLMPEEISQQRFFIAAQKDPEKLARLRDIVLADEAGRLVVLPVNPCLTPTNQSEMYICENGEVWAIYVTGCEAGPNSDGVFTVEYMTLDGDVFSADDIGKTVFLTRHEAEEALRKETDDHA